MKKTIIAAAVAAAVAAPAAFADVSISGMINPEFSDADGATGYDSSTNTDLVFKASEDLGNGMKAGMKYHLFNDDGGNSVADTSVSLSGDFGTVTAGRFETFNMAYFHGKADMDPSHDITLEDTYGTQGRGNGIAYVSPAMNGLSIGVSAVVDGGTASTVSSDDADATEVMVKYTNGGLEVAAGKTSLSTATSGADNDEEITNVFVGYTMGDLKVGVLNRKVDDADGLATNEQTGDNDSTTFNVAYTMGANTISAGFLDSDDARDGDSVIAIKHAMSKRTSVYLAIKNDDDSDDTTLVGLKHSF